MPNCISHILTFTLIHLSSPGALPTQRYPNGLDVYELRKLSIHTDAHTRNSGFSAARHQGPSARIMPSELALRVILWNGCPRTVTSHTMATHSQIHARRGRYQGLGELQANVRRKRYTKSEVVSTRIASVVRYS